MATKRTTRKRFAEKYQIAADVAHLLPQYCSLDMFDVNLDFVRDRMYRHHIDWRYRRVCWLLDNKRKPSPIWDDVWTVRAYRLERLLGRCHTAEDHQRLYETSPALYAVRAFWNHGDGPARWELEAWLLTAECWETIAHKVGLVAEGVEFIEKLWFNVRDKFEASSWIMHNAIRAWSIHPESPAYLGVYWRMMAFNGGPLVLDAAIRALTIHSAGDVRDPGEWRRLVLIKASFALHAFSSDDPRRKMRFIRICQRIMDVLDVCDDSELDEPMRVHVDTFLEQWGPAYGSGLRHPLADDLEKPDSGDAGLPKRAH